MMDAIKTYLQQFPNYSDAAFENAYPFFSEKTLEVGEYFLREGKVCKSIGFIEKGLVRILVARKSPTVSVERTL